MQWACLHTAGAQEWRESAGGEFEKARVQLERGEWLTANQILADVLDFDKVLCVCVCVCVCVCMRETDRQTERESLRDKEYSKGIDF